MDNLIEIELQEAQERLYEILLQVDTICKKHNIKYWLDGGTLLGAVRHRGFIPWDDDIDICMLREDYIKFLRIAHKEMSKKYNIVNYDNCSNPKVLWSKMIDINTLVIEDEADYNEGLFIDIFPVDYANGFKYYIGKIIIKILFSLANIKLNNDKSKKGLFFKLVNLFKIIFCKVFRIDKAKISKLSSNISSSLRKCNKIGYGLDVTYFNFIIDLDKVFPLKQISFREEKFFVPNQYKYYLEKMYGRDFMSIPDKEDRVIHHSKIFRIDSGQNLS